MHQCDGRLDGGVGEVQVERAQLPGQQHALVDDGARAHGAHVEDVALGQAHAVGALLDGAPGQVQGALEFLAARCGGRAHHERLPDARLAGAGRDAQVVGVHGHLAPKEHGQPHVVAALLKELAGLGKELGVAGEEQHGHAVVALVGQEAPALLGLLAEEPVGRLEEDARAVTRVGLQAGAPAVVHVE